MAEGRVLRFLKALKGKEEAFEANRQKRREEWCQCGHRRVFVMHSHWPRQAIWYDETPPHKFRRESDMLRVVAYEMKEKKEIEEWKI